MPGPNAIERSQKKLYLAIKSELALFEKRKPKELRAYERAFRSALPKQARPAQKKDLLKTIERANIVLVGDFHPFRQSQKGFLRLIEDSLPRIRRPVIALECLQQEHQRAVDEYLASYITAEELRDKIDFDKHWPFPWENYREILYCAKRLKCPVLALNIPSKKKGHGNLQDRDSAAASKITQEILEHNKSTIFTLYGELHLARHHLPRHLRATLREQARIVVVHQNNADFYWKTPTLKNGQKPEVLRLTSGEFCIQNSVPWVKLRSYLDWLEGGEDWEDEIDSIGMIHHYASLLGDAMGLNPSLPDVEVFTPDRLESGELRSLLRSASELDRALANHALAFDRTAYLPGSGTLILPSTSTNSLSEAASYLLWRANRGTKFSSHDPLTTHFLVGYLGSKVLNPKRKCNEVKDLQNLLKNAKSSKWDVLTRALTLLRPYLPKENLRHRSKTLRNPKEIEAHRLAGYILGERLFLALLREPKLLALVKGWYEKRTEKGTQVLLKKTSTAITRLSGKKMGKRDRF